jgi:hypothetical protein
VPYTRLDDDLVGREVLVLDGRPQTGEGAGASAEGRTSEQQCS